MPRMTVQMSIGLAGLLLSFSACAHREALKPSPPMETQATPPVPASPQPKGHGHSYVVRRGDNLWAIAARPNVLGDPFKWPLLFRLNRDEIQDPDLIYPRQDLSYRTDIDSELMDLVVKEAKDTPAFVHHSAPRKVLPMQY
jgi:hypothetical protein